MTYAPVFHKLQLFILISAKNTAPNFVCLLLALIKPMPSRSPSPASRSVIPAAAAAATGRRHHSSKLLDSSLSRYTLISRGERDGVDDDKSRVNRCSSRVRRTSDVDAAAARRVRDAIIDRNRHHAAACNSPVMPSHLTDKTCQPRNPSIRI